MKPYKQCGPFLLAFVLALVVFSGSAVAQVRANLSGGQMMSQEEPVVARLNCKGTSVQFARGLRWTPGDFSPVLSINDSNTLELPPSCYVDMACGTFKGKPVVVIVEAPACGGNAVSESYIVIELKSRRRHELSYTEARKAKLIP